VRLVQRTLTPCGFFIVYLGADGSGKSTVSARCEGLCSLATRRVERFHLFPTRSSGPALAPCTDPYGKPARGLIQSFAKLFYYWVIFLVGYIRTVRPFLVRNSFVIFDRYFCDLIADPRRYRFGAPRWMARLVNRFIPQPDLYILLDAPADVLQSRKQEVTPEQTARQRAAYLDLVAELPNAHVIDCARPVDEVAASVYTVLLNFAARRTARRLGFSAEAQ
jgi:thymidylate kinase